PVERPCARADHHRQRAFLRRLARARDRGIRERDALLPEMLMERTSERHGGGAEIDDARAPPGAQLLRDRLHFGRSGQREEDDVALPKIPERSPFRARDRGFPDVDRKNRLTALRGEVHAHRRAHDAEADEAEAHGSRRGAASSARRYARRLRAAASRMTGAASSRNLSSSSASLSGRSGSPLRVGCRYCSSRPSRARRVTRAARFPGNAASSSGSSFTAILFITAFVSSSSNLSFSKAASRTLPWTSPLATTSFSEKRPSAGVRGLS